MSYAEIDFTHSELLDLLGSLQDHLDDGAHEECADALRACIEDFRKYLPSWYRPELKIPIDQASVEVMIESLPETEQKEIRLECARSYIRDLDSSELLQFLEEELDDSDADLLEYLMDKAARRAALSPTDRWHFREIAENTEFLKNVKEVV